MWLKPLHWANPASSAQETAPPPLRHPSEMRVFEPLRFRADRRVPYRADEYTANEPTFDTVSQPFEWSNPQSRVAERTPQTDAERIAYEKEKFVWIRPFYWDNLTESDVYIPWRQEYAGTAAQQPSSVWTRPFHWSNAAPSYRWSQAATPADPAWLADSARGLHRLPPVDGWDALATSAGQNRTVAFMYQDSVLPAPTGEPEHTPPTIAIKDEEVTEPLAAPAEPGDNVAEELSDGLPFADLDEDGNLETPLSEQGVAGEKGAIAQAETLGSEPEDNFTLQFLRADTVLLDPGQWQFDYGVTYLLADTTIPVVNSSSVLEHARFRQRELLVPLELRYGLARRLQLFANVPFGWSNIEFTFSELEIFENDGGLGDVALGGTFLLREADECNPTDLVWTNACTMPTGIDPFEVPLGQPGTPSLGNGAWSLASNLLWIRSIDPVVIFYGFGTQQFFTRDLNGQSFRPGQEYNYQLGVGFAVNSKVTFSTRFNGAYITEPRLDGARFLGSIREPMSVTLATTVVQCNGLIEPFVDFGLTDESIEARFGVTWTRF